MTAHFFSFRRLLMLLCILLLKVAPSSASEWHTVELPARALNIAENDGSLWVCGADELIAVSTDGGKTWAAQHNVRNGKLLLSVAFANKQFGYAADTGGAILVTNDGGDTWNPVSVPSQVVYEASFSDQKHGIIHTSREIYTTVDGGATWNPVQINFF